MKTINLVRHNLTADITQRRQKNFWEWLHLDVILIAGLLLLASFGLFILYSAGNQDWDTLIRQLIRLGLAFAIMLVLAQIHPQRYQAWTPWLFALGISLLLAVLIMGQIGKGAQRWLDLWLFRFQPAEFMKIIVPMMLAWYLHAHPLPPTPKQLLLASIIIFLPALLIAKQPDLGTALIIAGAGSCVIILAGISGRIMAGLGILAIAGAPLLWHVMHDYQRERVLTFLNPERDPLGSGYHIIQSKIAIGSGGLFGKGWLNGTQAHLQFLPEHATDFIFAVIGEELGLFGGLVLLLLFSLIIGRGLYISLQAPDTFTRLLAGSITLTFFISVFVNMGMVTGLLPVVGIPLPLVSYGGTSMVTLIAGFGILMSIKTHQKLIKT